MSKRISKIAKSLKELGDIQVTEWDFMTLLNKDIKELEIGRSLRRLGNIQVTDWDFKGFINKDIKELEIGRSLRRLGSIQVTDWDFKGFINKDIKELEIGRSLKRLGNIRVMEWDFKTAMPTVSKIAHQEVDVVDLIKRAANYKVIDWDFKSAEPEEQNPARKKAEKRPKKSLSRKKLNSIVNRLKKFLQYVTVNLIDQPDHAQIKIQEIAPGVVRFKLVLVKKDVAMLIGTEGHTAAAIRSILKATAEMHGLHALLEILTHEEEAAAMHEEAWKSHGGAAQTSGANLALIDAPLAPLSKRR
ncbi:MAG: KH domain-containing protein [Verrucomicrobiota bacterium]